MKTVSPLVSKRWVLARMYEPNLIIVDCRFQLGIPQAGREAYEASHIPGAIFLDLEADLSAPVNKYGGRHPLPDPNTLANKLSQSGISNDSIVVAYDDQGGMYASRLWWLLRWLGHEHVFVMDEGFSRWKEEGYPVTTDQQVRIPARFIPNMRPALLADVNDMRKAINQPDVLIIDSRETPRYIGETEPIDKVAGHIPSAEHIFWKNNLDKTEKWKSPEERREALALAIQALDSGREVIVYCGSGVSACANVLSLHSLGYSQVRLYAGSWSDWISYPDNPVATSTQK